MTITIPAWLITYLFYTFSATLTLLILGLLWMWATKLITWFLHSRKIFWQTIWFLFFKRVYNDMKDFNDISMSRMAEETVREDRHTAETFAHIWARKVGFEVVRKESTTDDGDDEI